MELYAFVAYPCAYATNGNLKTAYTTDVLIAINREVAHTIAMKQCKKLFLSVEGWTEHQVSLALINQENVLTLPSGDAYRIRLEQIVSTS